jgi:hypothetical protein
MTTTLVSGRESAARRGGGGAGRTGEARAQAGGRSTVDGAGRARAGGRSTVDGAGRARAGGRSTVDGAGRARAGGRSAAGGAGRGRSDHEFPINGTAALRARPTSAGRSQSDQPEPTGATRLRVAPPVPVTAPRAPFVMLVLTLVVGGVLGILVLNTKINQDAFTLHDLRSEQGELDHRQQQLEGELAQRETPGNLAAVARQLGLVRAESAAYLRLSDGKQVGPSQPALSAPSVTGGQNAAGDAADQPAG